MNAHARHNTPTTALIDHLVHDDFANARSGRGEEGLDELMASIAAHGALQPLLVRPVADSDAFAVFAGSRRLRAIRQLIDNGVVGADFPIPITVCESSDDEAYEVSLAENVVREPMHPIDQFEAFSRLSDNGMADAAIAARFGIAERLVRQRKALGALHPNIREAWRAGKIGADAAEAFTMARDSRHQTAVFLKLQTENNLYGHAIRAAFGCAHDAGAALKFVGLEAYRAAGGAVVEDLFGAHDAISDPPLAKRLAAEALQKECERLIADGWSFALPRADVKQDWTWPRTKPSGKVELTEAQTEQKAFLTRVENIVAFANVRELDMAELDSDRLAELKSIVARLDPPLQLLGDDDDVDLAAIEERHAAIDADASVNAWGPRQKKKAGCFLELTNSGALQITYGVQKPEDPKAAAKDKAKVKGDDSDEGGAAIEEASVPEPAISAALTLALSQQRTIAAAKVLAKDPGLALCVAIAALESNGAEAVRLSAHGYYPAVQAVRGEAPIGRHLFDRRLAIALAEDTDERLDRLAVCVAGALDLQQFSSNPGSIKDGADSVVSRLDPEAFAAEALELFDAAAYFKGVNAALCNKALDEMGLPALAAPRPKKKAELAELCVRSAAARKWLPPELRHPDATKQPSLAQAMGDALAADGEDE